MTEAAGAARQAEQGEASRLIALYADGSDAAIAEAEKLTLGMIAESATWLKMGDPKADQDGETVRQWWIATVRKDYGGEEAEEFDQRWALAFENAKPKAEAVEAEGLAEALSAAIAEKAKPEVVAEPEAKAAEPAPTLKAELKAGASWAALQVPQGASELERLTYVPGLVGEIVEWIVSGARRPNRMMALGVSLAIVGTLVGRRIKGPTGSSTHLYIVILAPTGYGKDWPLHCGDELMRALGEGALLGPREWASSPGLWKFLKRNPLSLFLMDELGDELGLVKNQQGNEFVSKIVGTLKKCYNAWYTVRTGEKVGQESETITWPMPSIVGAATPQRFFETLDPRDLESGFANRFLILPFEGCRRPPEQDPPGGEPPKALIAALKKLPRQRLLGPAILDNPPGAPALPELEAVPWGAGASEVYFAFSREMDGLEEIDRQQYELGMRACENAVRIATVVAKGRSSGTVDREDTQRGVQIAECSFNAAVGGFDRYMQQYFEFPALCEKVLARITAEGGFHSIRNLNRDFRRSKKYGPELDRALSALAAEGRIKRGEFGSGARGRKADGWFLLGEDGQPIEPSEPEPGGAAEELD